MTSAATPEEEGIIRRALSKWIVEEPRCLKIIESMYEDRRGSKLERIFAIAGTAMQCYSPRSGEWRHLKNTPELNIKSSVIWNDSLVYLGRTSLFPHEGVSSRNYSCIP